MNDPDPVFIAQNEVSGNARRAWLEVAEREGRSKGAVFFRVSTDGDLVLVEGWSSRPAIQGSIRWMRQATAE